MKPSFPRKRATHITVFDTQGGNIDPNLVKDLEKLVLDRIKRNPSLAIDIKTE